MARLHDGPLGETRFDEPSERPAFRQMPDRSRVPEGRYTGAEARQGGMGRPVLYVLVAALILGAIYVVGMSLWGAGQERTQPGLLAPSVTSVPAPATQGAGSPPVASAPAGKATPAPPADSAAPTAAQNESGSASRIPAPAQ